MRSAQSALDEAQAHRSRLLAAFAVTVGSDGAVAGVLGLPEREVRLARRTVGKEDARNVADELLSAASRFAVDDGSDPQASSTASEQSAGYHASQFDSAGSPEGATAKGSESRTGREPRWTGAMDALLVGSWQTGVDLQVVAAEFGLDLMRLVSRAQQLSAEGRLSPPWAAQSPATEPRSGRHRRSPNDMDYPYDFYDCYGGHPASGSSWEVPSTVPEDMINSMPQQHSWPQYTTSGS
ncbi:hypothetical protein [Streptomyces sp. TP-A0874]|uniref:hypothetical protein n=1 Tax=Streptomyces sp. TP-A0874 TaxID=549819 RepID=UPI0008539BF7|nr:hypothetical protein [Streptomyces sp. TP-A0874]